jgi:hypothetical protein
MIGVARYRSPLASQILLAWWRVGDFLVTAKYVI